jgi:hypothetical protein
MMLPFFMWFSNPVTWMIAMMLIAGVSHASRKGSRAPQDESRISRAGSGGPEALAAALMFLTTAYRPSVEFIADAQIQEHEDADDDDQGEPDSPNKHFRRQLRRIREGKPVDCLVWHLE